MFKKILLAVDGSAHADKAAAMAKSLLDGGMAESIDIVNVAMGQVDQNYYMGSDISEKLIEGAKENGRQILQKAAAIFGDNAKVKTTLKTGEVAHKLVEISKDYDLIIMGSRGMNPVARLLMGSVSSKVSQYADCPVLLVK